MNLLFVLIGTGGHIIPLLPLISGLKHEGIGVRTVTRLVGVERHLVANPDLVVNLASFSGKPLMIKIRSLVTILITTIRITTFIRKHNIKGVVASGAFGSVPAILAAIYLRIPFFLIELNRIPGRVVRLTSRRAKAIFVAVPLDVELKGKVIVTGVPLRSGFLDLKREGGYVLVMGGSQGATFLNQLALHLDGKVDRDILLICGDRDYEWVRRQARDVEVISFTDRPWDYLAGADLVIARAGGLSTYELAYCRVPMILIPFPYATDQHQLANGQYYAEQNAAIIVKQGDPEDIASQIVKIIREGSYRSLAMRTPLGDGRERIIKEVKRLCSVR
ncbi:MAG TPA: hypothetical protein EYP58_04685 [bacterium (Candidatus Stahlbacteria)]|nr:hypothetical protein [Candidatus Stahlbacteria bacterium]